MRPPTQAFRNILKRPASVDGRPATAVTTEPQGFCVSIQGDDAAEAERTYRALGEGGVVQMPLGETV